MEQSTTDEAAEAAPASTPVPWYTLDPRKVGRSGMGRALFVGLLLVSFSVVPLWRLLWYFPVYALGDILPKRDTHGRFHTAWRWCEGQEIRVYQVPGVRAGAAETIAEGCRALQRDVHLDFTVKVMPMPANVLDAYQASLVERKVFGQRRQCVSFKRLEARLIELRDGDPHADMLVVNTPIAEAVWAHGMATFTSGLGVLEADNVSVHLGKHESGHLMGYLYHDTLPLYVVGYPWEGLPWSRDSLMVILGSNEALSPRSRDALRYFWRGMEQRQGRKYLTD